MKWKQVSKREPVCRQAKDGGAGMQTGLVVEGGGRNGW